MDNNKIGRQTQQSDEVVISSLKRVKAGEYPHDIAKELGISVTTVTAWCKKCGIIYPKKYLSKRDWTKIAAQL